MELSKSAKYVFLMHFIAVIIFGVWFFIAPETWSTLTGWPDEASAGRILGAALIGMAILGLLGYRASTWEEVEIIVYMLLIYNILGLVGMLWNYAYLTLPIAGWGIVGLYALFFFLFFYVYYEAKLKKA